MWDERGTGLCVVVYMCVCGGLCVVMGCGVICTYGVCSMCIYVLCCVRMSVWLKYGVCVLCVHMTHAYGV